MAYRANRCALLTIVSILQVPGWLYPANPPAPAAAQILDKLRPLHVPGSTATYTEATLNDMFAAPDWFPESHTVMPEIVKHGHAPRVYACGYCHTPAGQGRPENASLAGLPAPYIVQQLADFKSGARRAAWPGAYRPAELMIEVAKALSAEEAAIAADYFSQQRFKSHVRVSEVRRVPRWRVVGWVYTAAPSGGDEPLGSRLLEFAPDAKRHEHRDDGMQYVAYAPIGSLQRGASIARRASGLATPACVSCHGAQLQGVGPFPRLAGRSPTYLLRQLFAFQNGARSGATGVPMRDVVSHLSNDDMIAVCAYAASLGP